MNSISDTTLINRVLEGDISGYSELVNRYKDLSFTVAYRIIGNREDAEEIVQDAFLNVYKGLNKFRGKAKFSTWLYRIVYNTAVSKKRLKRIPMNSIEDMPHVRNTVKSDEMPGEDAEHAEKSWILEKALDKLAIDERTIVTLYYINNANVEEIHAITGFSRANIKVKLFRARNKLRVLLAGSTSLVFV